MLSVLATGGYDYLAGDKAAEEMIDDFARCLGKEIIAQEYRLITECQTRFDKALAEGASQQLNHDKAKLENRVYSYKLKDAKTPAHAVGSVLGSTIQHWQLTREGLDIPEVISMADAIILVRGGRRSLLRANWGRIAKKPLLPVARFDDAAEVIFKKELEDFDSKYANSVEALDYQVLNRRNASIPELAELTVQLVDKLCIARRAFVVMSFSEDCRRKGLSDIFKSCCKEYKYSCEKVNEDRAVARVIPAIWEKIRSAAFVIVDLTVPSENVYYELGYAEALGKELVVTAEKGTKLPFNISDLKLIEWTDPEDLRAKILPEIKFIKARQHKEQLR